MAPPHWRGAEGYHKSVIACVTRGTLRGVPTVLRDNRTDERVARDVELLANAYSEDAIATAQADADLARQADLETLVDAYGADGGGSAVVPVVWHHIRRYRVPYIVAAVVLGVLLFRQPVPPAAPLSPFDAGALDAETLSPEPSPEAGVEPPALSSRVEPLQIVVSGYASALGGTPVEQPPPGDGLPVEVLAGSVTKYSFFRLAGTTTTLKLAMLPDQGANLNDAGAGVELCHLATNAWNPERGVPTASAPGYTSDCIAGSRSDTVWTFTFVLDSPTDSNGWALVPVAIDNATFRITFASHAVS